MILETIAKETIERVKQEKEECSLDDIRKRAEGVMKRTPFAFEEALRGEGLHVICEVKKASPSKGIIAVDFPYLDIAKEYEAAGATCISVLTEPKHFLGSNQYLSEIAAEVDIPILRKDFIVDEYQIYQAKVIGADCVLLIVSLLSFDTLKCYLNICESLQLSALVEAHDEEEVKIAIAAGARLLGINNRNLKNFHVDIDNSLRLRTLIPKDIIVVAESGITTREDVSDIEAADIHVVLIGETLMRSQNKKQILKELRGYC